MEKDSNNNNILEIYNSYMLLVEKKPDKEEGEEQSVQERAQHSYNKVEKEGTLIN